MQTSKRGFTIVELLIVIVVIAILAAISIVAYNGIQARAQNTSVQNDLVAMAKKIEVEAADTGIYQAVSVNTNIRITKSAFDIAENNLYYCRNSTTNQYAISARSKSGKQYKLINGTISEHASKLYGTSTCDLITTGTVQYAWDQPTAIWQSWAASS